MSSKSSDPEPLDREALEKHLSYGIAMFERSPMGSMIEAIANRCWASVACLHCDKGILSDGSWCKDCNGTGYKMRRIGRSEKFAAPTARPNAAIQRKQKESPEPEEVTAYAVISGRLSKMDEVHEFALRACYGDWGAKWAESHAGRSWAATPFTRAGAELIRTDETEMGKRERPLDRIIELAQLDKQKPELHRGKLLSQAAKEAVILHRESVAEWNLIVEIERGTVTDVG